MKNRLNLIRLHWKQCKQCKLTARGTRTPTHGRASTSGMRTAISRGYVAATDSCFTLIGAHQRGKAIGLMNGEKIPAGKCPCRMEMIHPTIGWRQDKQGTQNMHKAHGFSDLYHVFAWNQCILGPALRHGCLTLLMLHQIEIFSGPGTIVHGSIRRPPCSLVSSWGCSLAIMYTYGLVLYMCSKENWFDLFHGLGGML